MTDFEKQLIKAMEYGCPRCTGDYMIAKMLDAAWYDIYTQEGDEPHIECDWHGYEGPEGQGQYVEVRCDCDGCSTVLWTAEAGWIPELQEVVKGECLWQKDFS